MTQEGYLGTSRVGNDWEHPRYRITLGQLRKASRHPRRMTPQSVDRINRYCQWVESRGDPNSLNAALEIGHLFGVSLEEARAILSAANRWAQRLSPPMPRYYWRAGWGHCARGTAYPKRQKRRQLRRANLPIPASLEGDEVGMPKPMDRPVEQIPVGHTGLSSMTELETTELETDLGLLKIRISNIEQRMTQQEDALAFHGLKHDVRERSKGPSKLTRFHRAVQSRIWFLVTGR